MVRLCFAAVLLTAVLTSCGSPAQRPGVRASAGSERLILNIRNDDGHYSAAIYAQNSRWLIIVAEQPTATLMKPIRLRLRFRDDAVIEGVPEQGGGGGNNAWTTQFHSFDAQRPLSKSDLAALTIWVGGEMFEVFPS